MTEPALDQPRYNVTLRFDGEEISMGVDPGIHVDAIGRPLLGRQDPPFRCGWSVHTSAVEDLRVDAPVFYFLDAESAQQFAAHLSDFAQWPGEAYARQTTEFLTSVPSTTACDFRLVDGAFPDLLPEVRRHLLDWDSLLQLGLFHHFHVAGSAA